MSFFACCCQFPLDTLTAIEYYTYIKTDNQYGGIMGEYAFYNNESVKIGTCEAMYYLRYEDRNKVTPQSGSLDPARTKNLFWRLPFPDEDHINPGSYESYNRSERLWAEDDPFCQKFTEEHGFVSDPGRMQVRHDKSGLMLSVACYHGARLPEGSDDIRASWNGKGWSLELRFVKNTADEGIKPVVWCRHCEKMWRFDWSDVLPYLHGEMKARLEFYAI